jgi:hypothetical protein
MILNRKAPGIVYLLLFVCFLIFYGCDSRQKNIPHFNIIVQNEIGWTDKESCIVDFVNGNDSIRFNADIICRGGSSSRYGKHSFALKTDKIISLDGLPFDNEWILNASFIDKTFMRHKVNYDLFMEMNPKNIAPKTRYINISINNDYYGFFVLMERLNAKSLGLNKKDNLAMIFKEPPVFRHSRILEVQDSLNYYHQKFPKKSKSDKTEYLEQFRSFLTETTEEVFNSGISKWVDLENIIDWHLLLLLSNNDDGVVKNFYLYKIDSKTPFRIAIWDCDHSFGRDGDYALNMMERNVGIEESVLFSRLMNTNQAYKTQLKNRWLALRNKNIFSAENIQRHIDRNHNLIKNEILVNKERWKTEEYWYADENDYQQELKIIEDFLKVRIDYLDGYFAELK